MKNMLFRITLLGLSALSILFAASSWIPGEADAQGTCDPGKECGWVNVTNVTEFGVTPSASSQQFENVAGTKDKLCQLRGYQYNKGEAWATQLAQWNNCNGEYHVNWAGSYWESKLCNRSRTYVTNIYCARNMPGPTVQISANPMIVQWGNRTTVSWAASNVTSCQASGDWGGSKPSSGSEESGAFYFGGKTFTITCQGSNGETASDSVSVAMDIIPSAPTVSWTAFPNSPVNSGEIYQVSATGQDKDGDLAEVSIEKDGGPAASGNPGVTYSGSDTGPRTITFTATARDARGDTSRITRTLSVSAPPPVAANAPSISWTSAPSSAQAGASYRVEARATDADGDLTTVSIDKNGSPFAYAGGGDGYSGTSGNSTTDSSAGSVSFRAWATDRAGHSSASIYHSVQITAAPQPVTGTVSASPSCVAPGGTITVTGSASGSGITSNVLEKDSNGDGVFGTIASRGDAGTNSASVSVPSGETSGRYDFRTVVNGSVLSNTSVTISATCGGAPQNPFCWIFGTCGNTNPPVNTPPSVSLSSSASCVGPGQSITLTSTANGSPINSHTVEKDSHPQDGVFGTHASFGPGAGTRTTSVTLGSAGRYSYYSQVNGSVRSGIVNVTASAACAGNPINNPGNPGNPGGNGGPAPLVCTGGRIPVNGSCACPAGTVWTGASCIQPDFTAGMSNQPLLIQVIPLVGGTSRAGSVWLSPVGNYSQAITLSASHSTDYRTVEYSWNGGPFSASATHTVSAFGGVYPNTTLTIRVTGSTQLASPSITVTARGADGKTKTFPVSLQINKTDPKFNEI